MFKTIGFVLVVLIVAVLIYAKTRPDIFRVERATSIKAPPEKIFALINDFRACDSWSPWEKKDPAMKRIFSAATSGKGATYAWEGNKNVGQGRMEITESSPSSRIEINLDFVKPFEAHNIVVFTLEPEGEMTKLTWTMQGHTPYLAKIIHVFCNMDRMVGKDFEAGLAALKATAEQ
jgi:uncharacterized protein YndB with AHSA1/START domain